MAVDPELLEILVCPKSRGELTLVELPAELRSSLIEKYREHFRDEEPVVEQGLYCAASGLVYPIVSDIPIMLIEEALPASVLGEALPVSSAGR
jgi:uncharacterized protein YbaR (Trm112 family)